MSNVERRRRRAYLRRWARWLARYRHLIVSDQRHGACMDMYMRVYLYEAMREDMYPRPTMGERR